MSPKLGKLGGQLTAFYPEGLAKGREMLEHSHIAFTFGQLASRVKPTSNLNITNHIERNPTRPHALIS